MAAKPKDAASPKPGATSRKCKKSGDKLKDGKCPNPDCPLYNKPQ